MASRLVEAPMAAGSESLPPSLSIAPLESQLRTDGQIQRLGVPLSWQFLFIEEGRGWVVFDGTQRCFQAGTLICVPPSAMCKIGLAPGTRGMAITIDEVMFRSDVLKVLPGNQRRDSSFWSKYYSLRVLDHSPGPDKRVERQNICRELELLARYLGRGGDPAIMGSALVILFNGLPRHSDYDVERNMLPSDDLSKGNIVIAFRTLLEEHFTDRLKVADYARLLGVTPRTLLRACRTMTGRTAVAVIHDRLIVEATRLLRHSSRSISEISYSLGFEDVSYFSRFIKAHAGQCPVEFRRHSLCRTPKAAARPLLS